jgi:hypothetical protein
MPRVDAGAWPPMLWVGGAQGAGKSVLAWSLAHAEDLPLHPVDLWSYDHHERLPASGSTLDDDLARGPQAAADAFEAVSRARLGLVLADVAARGLGEVPALAEGPQLLPDLAGPLPPGWAVWLVPDPGRTRHARQQRLARERGLEPADGAPAGRTERLVERDAVLAARIREAAARAARTVIEVPEAPDWAAVATAVRDALAPGLRGSPRLAPGDELRRQRRRENAAASRQGRLWQRAAGLGRTPSYPFACECGGRGCRAVWPATPAEYDAAYAERPLVAPEHR